MSICYCLFASSFIYSYLYFIITPYFIFILSPCLFHVVFYSLFQWLIVIPGFRIQESESIIKDSQFVIQDPRLKIWSAGFRYPVSRIHTSGSQEPARNQFQDPDPGCTLQNTESRDQNSELGIQNPQFRIQIPGPESRSQGPD